MGAAGGRHAVVALGCIDIYVDGKLLYIYLEVKVFNPHEIDCRSLCREESSLQFFGCNRMQREQKTLADQALTGTQKLQRDLRTVLT